MDNAMILTLFACSFRTMIGGSITDISTLSRPSELEPRLSIATQHYLFLPVGPSTKVMWSSERKQFSAGLGAGLIHLVPKKSKWLMNPPTVGVQLIEQHYIQDELYWGVFSPFVQLTAPPLCLNGKKYCQHSVSLFAEYAHSNVLGHENEHSYTVGIYWSPSN